MCVAFSSKVNPVKKVAIVDRRSLFKKVIYVIQVESGTYAGHFTTVVVEDSRSLFGGGHKLRFDWIN